MKDQILFYTFPTWHATSFKLARFLQNTGYKVVYLGHLNTLLNHIKSGKYKYVIGMGKYRKNAVNIRIETLFQNKYRKQQIIMGGIDFYESTWSLPIQDGVVVSKTLTHGPCNRSGYFALCTIAEHNLDTKFAFLHIPAKYNFDRTKIIFEHWITDLL